MQHMRLTALVLIAGVLTPLAGCQDSDGSRITMQQWWKGRFGSSKHDDARPRRVEQETDSDNADTVEVQTARLEHNPGPAAVQTATGGAPAAEQAQPPRRAPEAADSAAKRAATPETPRREPPPSAIHANVLIVNDDTVRVEDILEPLIPRFEKLARELPPEAYYDRVVSIVRLQIIEAVAQRLIWQRAQRQINEDLEPQIQKVVDKMEKERINREFKGRETLYEMYLAKHGKTRAEVRERLRRTVVIDGYLRESLLPLVPRPRKPELMSYYKAHLADYTKTAQREMFLIDVPIAAFLDPRRPITEPDREAAAQKARTAIEDAAEALKSGDKFEDVARKYSLGVNAAEGGAWGPIKEPLQGRWQAPSKRLFELRSGQTSEIVEAAKSFFIVKAGKVEEGGRISFQEAQPGIANTLRQRKFLKLRYEFLQQELKRSTIGSLETFIKQVLQAVPPPR